MKKLGIISYDFPHLKTEQIIHRLLNIYNPKDIKIYTLPFKKFKNRKVLFNHRPIQQESVFPYILSASYNIDYKKCMKDTDILNDCELYIIAGSGIISPECIKLLGGGEKKIINCHPGIIPNSRGLDAFKWAIFYKRPVGNTLHFIDEKVDSGKIISVIPTPLYITDTLDIFARRHYENEINMIVNFQYYLDNPINLFENIEVCEPSRRMSTSDEVKLHEIFEDYKQVYCRPYLYQSYIKCINKQF